MSGPAPPAPMTAALDAEAPGRIACPILVVQFFPDGSYDFQDELDGPWKKQPSSEESRNFLESAGVGAVPDQIGTFQMPTPGNSRQPTPAGARQVTCRSAAPLPGPSYLQRMLGNGSAPGSPPLSVMLWAMAGSFLGILVLSLLHFKLVVPNTEHLSLFVGSFGAQAVLLFGANQSPLTQPWNVTFGSVISSFIGVTCWQIFGVLLPLPYGIGQVIAPPVAVSLAIGAMMVTRSVHPPAGALALIATIQPGRPRDAAFMYVLFPALAGAIVHMIVALLFNNLSTQPCRMYPVTWRFYQAPPHPKLHLAGADKQLSTKSASEMAKMPLNKNNP